MKKVISAKDVEELIRKGADLNSALAGAILTPSARDALRSGEPAKAGKGKDTGKAPAAPKPKIGRAHV